MGKRIYSSSLKKGDFVKFKSGVQRLETNNGCVEFFVKDADYIKDSAIGIIFKIEDLKFESERMFHIYVSGVQVKVAEGKFGTFLEKL